MKNKHIIMAAVLLSILPTAVVAQQHIQQAFDELRQSKNQQEVMARHTMERNPDTGKMEGLSDVYDFVIPQISVARKMIGDIEAAFRADEAQAYSVSSGNHGGDTNYTTLAVGDSNSAGVAIGLKNDSRYVYACFLDPDDTLRQHRYAYALEWAEKDDGSIVGRIAKTYATTLKYRQGRAKERVFTVNGNTFSFGSNAMISADGAETSEKWLTKFYTYKNLFLKNPNGTSANSYATLIYRLCKDAKPLEDAEKNMIATEMLKLKKRTRDEFVQQLFDMGIERLKN